MAIPQSVIDEVSRRVRIEDVVGDYVQLKARGDRLWGLSPFKSEKTPSFSVNPERGLYYCFATNQGGTVFTFLMQMEGISFPEAVRRLAARVGVSVEEEGPEAQRDGALRELLGRTATAFHYLLMQDPRGKPALEYAHSRGLNSESLEAFQLGFAPDEPGWLAGFLRGKGYSADFLAESGLFSRRYPDRSLFVGRLVFPITDRAGAVLGFGGRSIDGREPKYLNSPETPVYRKKEQLFGLHLALPEIRKSRRAILVEGYLDVIALHQAGIPLAVAPLGTAFTPQQAKALSRVAATLDLMLDADSAGQAATIKSITAALKAGLDCHIITMAPGRDPADIAMDQGSQALQELVYSAEDVVDYLARRIADRSDGRTVSSALDELVFPVVRSMQSAVDQEQALRRLSDQAGLDPDSVKYDFRQQTGERPRRVTGSDVSVPGPGPQRRERANPPDSEMDLRLMLAVAVEPGRFKRLRAGIEAEEIEGEDARGLFLMMEELYRSGELTQGSIGARLASEEQDQLLQRLASGEFDRIQQDFVESGSRRIRMRSFQRQMRSVEAQIRQVEANSPRDAARHRSLLEEKIYLDRALNDLKDRTNERSSQ